MAMKQAHNVPLGQQLHAVETGVSGQHYRIPVFFNHSTWVFNGLNVVRMALRTSELVYGL